MKYILMCIVLMTMGVAHAETVIVKKSPTVIVQDHGNSFAADVARAYVNRNNDHVIFYNDSDYPRYNYGYDPHSPAAEMGAVCGNLVPAKYQACVKDYLDARKKISDKYRN